VKVKCEDRPKLFEGPRKIEARPGIVRELRKSVALLEAEITALRAERD